MTFRAGESGNPKGRPKGKNGVAALAAKAAPENIRWLQNVRDLRAPWPLRMKAVELLLAYARGRPWETIPSRGDTPGRAASASVVNYTKQEKASFVANDGADITQVQLPANGYEIDPETRQPMFPELADDPDEGEKLLELPPSCAFSARLADRDRNAEVKAFQRDPCLRYRSRGPPLPQQRG